MSSPIAFPGQRQGVFQILVTYVILISAAAFFLMPIYMMVTNGLKSPTEVSLATMWRLPEVLSLDGIKAAWGRLEPAFFNSVKLSVFSTILACGLGSIAGYVFAQWRFPYSNLVFALIIFGMFIPYQAILIPLVLFTQKLGLYGSISGLIIVHTIYGLPIHTLIFRNFYSTVPPSLIEAARVDNAGLLRIYWRIILPLSPPAFVVSAVFQFTNAWNDFLFGVTLVPNPAAQPVTVALNNLSGAYSVNWNEVMAGSIIAALPTAVLYIVLGRFFVRGLTSGSVKA